MNRYSARQRVDNYLKTKGEMANITQSSSSFPFSGLTFSYLGDTRQIIIGYDGFARPTLLNAFVPVEDSFVINSGLSISHENDHFEKNMSYNSGTFDKIIFMSDVISSTNRFVYKENYCSWPHEISAELSALKSVRSEAFFSVFSPEDVNKAIKEREEFGLKQKGQCFHGKDNLDEAIKYLEYKEKNPIKFIRYFESPYETIANEDGTIHLTYSGTIQEYMANNKDSVLWKMKYDTMSYLIPFDFAFAVSVNTCNREDILFFREKMKTPSFPIQLSEYKLETFEREWSIKLEEHPNLIIEKATELGLLEERDPKMGTLF